MTSVDQQDDEVKREAIAWIRRLTSGEATAAEAEALRLWRARSPAHAAAFISASRLWKDLGPAGRNLRANGTVSTSALHYRHRALNRRALLGGGLAAAAAAGAYAVMHPPLQLWPSWTELAADYRTGTGEQQSVSLPGNVSIRMNTQTSIAVRPAANGIDNVELITGEALFSTASASGRPFAVLAAGRWTTATAAKFDVRYLQARGDMVRVTCLEGELFVASGGEAIRVQAGQQLRYDSNGQKPPDAIDPEVASAWQRGILVFRFTPLADVVDEINRYRPGRIVIVDAELGRTPVSGRFRIDNIDEILTRIEQAFGARIRSLPGGLVLLS